MSYLRLYSSFLLFLKASVNSFKYFFSFWLNSFYFSLSLLLLVFVWLQVFSIYSKTKDDLLIFHYTVDFGIDLIGDANLIFILSILASFFSALNFILALVLSEKKHYKLIWHFLGISTILINIFILLSLYSVNLINFPS